MSGSGAGWEEWPVWLVLAGSLFYLLRHVRRHFLSSSGGCACGEGRKRCGVDRDQPLRFVPPDARRVAGYNVLATRAAASRVSSNRASSCAKETKPASKALGAR
ncbi:MAG: hypothetical protein HQM03_17040 [Magnetococcales bacterium]|nr:hypothetical protein [Magnetococcales bacterium]